MGAILGHGSEEVRRVRAWADLSSAQEYARRGTQHEDHSVCIVRSDGWYARTRAVSCRVLAYHVVGRQTKPKKSTAAAPRAVAPMVMASGGYPPQQHTSQWYLDPPQWIWYYCTKVYVRSGSNRR